MIEIKNLCKSFGEKEVLKDISAVFESGKTNLIIGQSGSGKTVLIKNLVGLLEPTSEESTIAKFIEKRGEGIHHLAFKIEDGVANALAEVEGKGIRLIDKAPRKGAEGLDIAFLHPKSTLGVLTELCEKPE